jgi:ribosomal protein S18 acetylase RimI-like enzyme
MIRAYQQEDLETLVEIGNLAWRDIYRMFRECFGDELFQLQVPDPQSAKGEQIRSHCQHHPECVIVYEEAGRVVGFVTFRMDCAKGMGELGNNGVHPDVRGRGIAQELYAAALDRFRQAGLQYAKVHTGLDPAHGPARRAYEKAGFNIRHEDVEYFRKL